MSLQITLRSEDRAVIGAPQDTEILLYFALDFLFIFCPAHQPPDTQRYKPNDLNLHHTFASLK